jgi:hypothetical protein
MALVISGLVLAALTGCVVWWVTDRFWHSLVIVVLAVALFPLVAGSLTGDVSRYLPAGTFAEGADGKDQIVLASAVATILIAVILATCIWVVAAAAWRRLRRK